MRSKIQNIVFILLFIVLLAGPVSAAPQLYLDQYNSYLKLNMHMNGTNGGNIFIDETGKTVTPYNTTTVTATKYLGNASANFNQTVNYLSLSDSDDWYMAMSDFTISVWIKKSANGIDETIIGQSNLDATSYWNLYFHTDDRIIFDAGDPSIQIAGTSQSPITDTNWHNVVVQRNGSVGTIYVDGALYNQNAGFTGNMPNSPGNLSIGRVGDYTNNFYFNGYEDEIGLWKGVAIPISEIYPQTVEIETPIPPVATFTATPLNGTTPLSVQFNETSTSSGTSWIWNATNVTGNNIPFTFNITSGSPLYTFNTKGNYSIILNSTNSGGSNISTQTTFINVSSNNVISSNFSISNTSGYIPLLTHFTDTSTTVDATIDSWQWDFGDGNTSTTQNPDHTYDVAGTHSVNLTITNISYSLVSTKIRNVTVYNIPPVANFTANQTIGSPPMTVQFNDTSIGTNISIYNWSFGDGNISTLQNPVYTYESVGEYQVNLTVTNDGGSSTKLKNITVALIGAHFTANQSTGVIPMAVQFTDTSIGNFDTWNWSVDDGTLHWFNKTIYADRNLEYVFNNAGSWRVNLSVQNISESGPIYSTSMNITATNIPPIASFTSYPSAGSTETIFVFNDTSTGVVTYRNWSLGDGNYSSTQNVTHMFPSNGVYNVNLTVSNDGGSSFVVHQFTVSPFAVTTYISPTSGVIPLLVIFNETYSGLIPDSYYWEFGDGATSTNKNTTHTYTTIGTFNVNHRVINDSTILWSNTTSAVTALGGSVTANFTANITTGNYPLVVQFTDTSTYINATPSSWYWVFGDGYTSTLQSPSHTYSNAGSYSVNFTTNTNQGSSYKLRTGYISVGGVAANGRQDVILIGSHNITLYVKDANSGNLISSATVFDEMGRELTSYGNGVFTGYYTTGQHTFTANATNYYTNRATYLVSSNLIQTIYLTQVATSVSTTWYTPKTIQISFTDVYGNQLTGASVNARYNETTLPNGVSDLISNYGMNANVANEALNGTLLMSGTTDTSGEIVFTMLSTIKYDIVVTYGGQTNYYSIYPQNPQYQFKFVTTVATDNIWNDLYANGNTKVWATEPDLGNVTFWWSFQDMTNLTTRIDFYLKDVDLNTTVYTTNITSPIAGSIYQLNYTVLNERGKNYIAWENYTRDV